MRQCLILILLLVVGSAHASYDFEGDGDNDYASVAAVPRAVSPMTMAGWFKAEDVTSIGTFLWIGDTGSANDYFTCWARGDTAGDPIGVVQRDFPFFQGVTTTGYTAGTWYHAACVFVDDEDRSVFIDGGSEGNITDLVLDPSSVDTTALGRHMDTTPNGSDFAGKLAHWAVWDIELSNAEIATLAGGGCPTDTQGSNIVAYWPMTSDGSGTIEDTDTGTYDLTITGTVTFDGSDNPSGVCSSTPIPIFLNHSRRRHAANDPYWNTMPVRDVA